VISDDLRDEGFFEGERRVFGMLFFLFFAIMPDRLEVANLL